MKYEVRKDPVIVKMINSRNKPYKRNDRPEMLPLAMRKYARKIVNECAKHYLEIINLCMNLEEEISSLMLVQMIASVVMLCFNLFQLSLVSMNQIFLFFILSKNSFRLIQLATPL